MLWEDRLILVTCHLQIEKARVVCYNSLAAGVAESYRIKRPVVAGRNAYGSTLPARSNATEGKE